MQEATREDLELNAHKMQKFIDGPIKFKTILLMLQNELHTGSKTVYPDAMEARVFFQPYPINHFWEVIM